MQRLCKTFYFYFLGEHNSLVHVLYNKKSRRTTGKDIKHYYTVAFYLCRRVPSTRLFKKYNFVHDSLTNLFLPSSILKHKKKKKTVRIINGQQMRRVERSSRSYYAII